MRHPAAIAVLLTLTTPVYAGTDELDWTVQDAYYLEARVGAEESDASLRLACKSPEMIEVRIGAEEMVGKGKGEEVALKLRSGGKQAELTGISEPSEDAEMTGGTELVTRLAPDDPLFSVLRAGKDVEVSGGGSKGATWSAKGMKAAIDKFLGKCKSLAH